MRKSLTKIITSMLVACMALAIAPFSAFGTGFSSSASGQGSTSTAPQAPMTTAAASDLDLVLVFDVSASMEDSSAYSNSSKLQSAKRQVAAFFTAMDNPNDTSGAGAAVRAGVVSFSDNGKVESQLTADDTQLAAAINGMRTGNMTNMYEGLDLGIDMLEASQAKAKIIVLLSDGENNEGHSDDEVRALASQAKQDGIVIYCIGFGPASSLDEDMLEYLANQTGGQYAHEDSSDIYSAALGVFAMMMQAQMQASGQTIIGQSTGAVGQGQTVSVNDIDMPQSGNLTTFLYWPGSTLTMQFVDPNNVEVTSSYPGYTVDDTTIPTKIVIQNAMAGTWKATVTGVQVSMSQEPFFTISSYSPAVAAGGGGGGPVNGGMIFVFLIAIVGIGAILLTYAMSKRKAS